MRVTALLLAMLAAAAAHSHDAVDLPELPIPEIDQLFPVDDIAAAVRWADWESHLSFYDSSPHWIRFEDRAQIDLFPKRWHVVALAESHFVQLSELLAGIQEDLQKGDGCGFRGSKRFTVYLLGTSQGGVDNEFLWTFGAGLNSLRQDTGWEHHVLKNRFSVAGGQWAGDTELRDTGMSMRFHSVLIDNAFCAGYHTSHSNGSPRHSSKRHSFDPYHGPSTDWLPVADLLDGNVAVTPPEEPAEPAEPAEPEAETPAADNSAELAQLQATVAALRDSLRAAGVGAAALRGSLLALQAQIDALKAAGGTTTTTITLVDTVEIARVDTVHFCPPTDEDRQNLFDAFTGVNSDTSGTEGAGKATAVRPSSWGAIKALMQED